MKAAWSGLTRVVRGRIFLKYMLATLLIGVAANAGILAVYYGVRQERQDSAVAAEIATVAARITGPAAAKAEEGAAGEAREILSIFAAFPYVVCADLRLGRDGPPAASWPAIGCERIRTPGRELRLTSPGAGAATILVVRTNASALANELLIEFAVLVALGLAGGLALTASGAGAFLWLINRPLALLLDAIERFERANDPQRVRYRSSDEIGKVVASYNIMLDREVGRVSQLREAHAAIMDSVAYATRIQRGLLPAPDRLAAAFGDWAALWEPRDLVSGDIYWVHADGSTTTVALIDCTGHGVPGGFMTMLAIASLERIFIEKRDPSPAFILSRLSDLTRSLLNQDVEHPASNDGMDAAVCRIDSRRGAIVFAGARLSLLIRDGGRVQRLRGDRVSLGYHETPSAPRFKETTLNLEPSATCILATDGVTDQIGGSRRLPFGHRRLAQLAQAHATAPLDGFIERVARAMNDHAAGEPRMDDVTVLAFAPKRSASAEMRHEMNVRAGTA